MPNCVLTRKNFKDICQCTYDADGDLTSVIIPENVTSIYQRIFSGEYYLHTVHMLCDIDVIPDSMFDGCIALAHVTLPNKLVKICYNAFINCESLKHITLPNTLREIYNGAFFRSGLVSIDIPNGTTNIGTNVFKLCRSLMHIRLPNTLGFIPYGLLGGCTKLTSLTIPPSVVCIDMQGLIETNIQSLVIPSSVKYIGAHALAHSAIESLTILSSHIHIDTHAVAHCHQLQHLSLPNTPIDIDASAFAYSSGVYNTLEEHGYCTDNYTIMGRYW